MEIKGATGKKSDDGREIYRAVATSDSLDRYGDVVLPKGADLSNFMKNPVLLGIHDYNEVTIGHVLTAEVMDEEGVIEMEFVFAKDAIGEKFESRYESGDMRAFSIGFRPKSAGVVNLWFWWDDEPDMKSIEVEMPDGSEQKVSFKGMEHVPYRIFKDWEMLELSAVPVPANPDALMKEAAEGMIRKAMEHSPAMKSFAQSRVREMFEPLLKALADLDELPEEVTIDGHVDKHHCATVVDEKDFDAVEAQVNLVANASADKTGEKETINWAKYSMGFAHFDASAPDNFASYKFLHHGVVTGEDGQSELVLSWRGLKAAMTALLGSVDGENVSDDVKAAYDHLASHFIDLGKEVPELREYEDEELSVIDDAPLTEQKATSATQPAVEKAGDGEGTAGDGTADGEEKDVDLTALVGMFNDLKKTIDERLNHIEKLAVAFNIKASTISDTLSRSKVARKKAAVDSNGDGDADLEISADLMEDLERVAE
jgi:phage head maturation protease